MVRRPAKGGNGMKFRVIIVCATLLAHPALTQQKNEFHPDNRRCGDINYRSFLIDEIQKHFVRAVSSIERVPPSDAEFLRREIDEAIDSLANSSIEGRLNVAISNRYYHPLQVQDSFKMLSDALNDARISNEPKHIAEILFDAAKDANHLSSAIDKYLEFDAARTPRVIPSDKSSELYFAQQAGQLLLRRTFMCVINQWR